MVLPSEGDDRCHDVTLSFDEPSIKVRETKKGTDVVEVFGGTPLGNGFELFRVHGYSVFGDNQAQIGDLLLVEFTFIRSKVQSHFSKLFKYSADM